ncbi:MAG: hypothetical protein Q9166_005807 [cf. Caloplaca sp. 2 TL-2023]
MQPVGKNSALVSIPSYPGLHLELSEDSGNDIHGHGASILIDVYVFGLRGTPGRSLKHDVATSLAIDARGIVIALVRCSKIKPEAQRRMYIDSACDIARAYCHKYKITPLQVKGLFRLGRPWTRSMDTHTQKDIKTLSSIFSLHKINEPNSLVMACADSFTANITAFYNLFSKLGVHNATLAIQRKDEVWTTYQIAGILAKCEYSKKPEGRLLANHDTDCLKLLKEPAAIALHKNLKKSAQVPDPLVARESIWRK